MARSARTMAKVAAAFAKKAAKAWARAKAGEGGHNYGIARRLYDTAKRATASAAKAGRN